ncbi:MAG: glycosyltransferase family 4 protein [Peptoanaerobacter stomatis]|uniref:glycosyltransferase family 4 protein n=1 Tax=Peptoanaerobacter stomatis TaxID=796937 RepID=UPI003F9FADD6
MSIINFGKINLYIPDERCYISATDYSAHIIVRYDGGHCGGIDPHIIGICKKQKETEKIMPLLIIVSRSREVLDDYKKTGIAYVDCTKCINNFETAIQVKKLLKHIKIVIVHSHGYSTNYFLFMLKKLDPLGFGKVKTVVTCHGWVEFNLYKKLLTYLDFKTYSMADALICVSGAGTKRIERFKSNKIVRTIRNGILSQIVTFNKEEINNFLLKHKIPDNKKIICYVGRLDQEKRPDRFVQFAFKLAKLRKDVHFLIVGDGDLMDKLKEESKMLGLDSYITFTGEIYPPSIVYYLSELLYLSSDTEGIPMCVLESMSFGTPVLASDVGGLKEIIENDKDGFLFQKECVDNVVSCANYLLDSPLKLDELSANSIIKIKEKFSVERMQCETMEVYKELLNS